jgi:hypothetical protein
VLGAACCRLARRDTGHHLVHFAPPPTRRACTCTRALPVPQGTKEFPQCGFSNTVVQILRSVGAPFESVNILENEALRSGMKEYSQWPT